MEGTGWPTAGGRIGALRRHVTPAAPAADIGAGDGHLALALRSEGIPKVVATEASRGPYERLVAALGGAEGIDVRFGWGLRPLGAGEVETAVIAGMGPRTIADIVDDASHRRALPPRLVLAPMRGAALLKRHLQRARLPWSGEDLTEEGGRFYELLLVDPEIPRLSWDPDSDPMGPVLSRRRDALAMAYRRHLMAVLETRLRKKRLAGVDGDGDRRALDALGRGLEP